MKIAFVGKGGSGKSTLTSLFVRYLQQQDEATVLAIDADINMNLAGLLGTKVPEKTHLSCPEVADAIRRHLKGTNPRVSEISKFLPTTPPGRGSNMICAANDPVLLPYAATVSQKPLINLLTVGTYEPEGIGQSCYHSNLFVAENLLSHTKDDRGFHIVCDMVAGTDAFAYSLHLQFDAIALIAEPTPESIEVCNHYLDLARESGIDSLVNIVGNKVADREDEDFIRRRLGREPLAIVPVMSALKRARQHGEPVTAEILTPDLERTMRIIEQRALSPAVEPAQRMTMLHELHRKLNAKQWVRLAYGDVAGQIDPQFHLQLAKESFVDARENTGVLI
jgi:CO dehydrogenase maturation factor